LRMFCECFAKVLPTISPVGECFGKDFARFRDCLPGRLSLWQSFDIVLIGFCWFSYQFSCLWAGWWGVLGSLW
jgi:hypothetical protein